MSATRITGDAQQLIDIVPRLTGQKPVTQASGQPAIDRESLSYFSSVSALAAHCKSVRRKYCWHDSPWDDEYDFRGTRSMTEACALARDGWPEGAERVAKLRDRINATRPVARQYVQWSVGGTLPNVPRYVAGNPMHMRVVTTAQTRKRPVITLISDMSASCMVDACCISNRAAVVAAIVDAIESAGFNVHLIAVANSTKAGLHALTAVNIKDSNQPADLGQIAFGLGHASMFRRLSWVPWCEDSYTRDLSGNMGFPTTLPKTEDLAARAIYLVDNLNNDSGKFQTEDKAATAGLQWLIESLRKQGCPALGE